MNTQQKQPKLWLFRAGLAAPFLAVCAWSCSFQDFGYLENGAGAAGASATAGTAGNAAGVSGTAGSTAGGSGSAGKAGSAGSAGTSGSTSGTGGEAGATGGSGGGLVNPSFETASMDGWAIDPPEAASTVMADREIYVQPPVSGSTAKDGNYVLSTWNMTKSYKITASQVVTGLEDGTYTFQGWFSRASVGNNDIHLFARNCGGADHPNVPAPATDSAAWASAKMTGIEVVGGSCEVGVYIDANGNAWNNMDAFSFTKE